MHRKMWQKYSQDFEKYMLNIVTVLMNLNSIQFSYIKV